MKSPLQHCMILIYGPTGVGKSAFALALGKFLPIEIINADMGQLYTPLTIGTAKPLWQQEPIPHHLYDIIDEPRDYSVMAYRDAVLVAMQGVWQRGNIPVLVGGSGFYLHALLFPPLVGNSIKEDIHEEEVSWELLAQVDPERARALHPNDTYRIARALAIWRATGTKPSQFQRNYDPPASFLLINIEREREELYSLVNDRTQTMIDAGWIDECRQLAGTPWEAFVRRKKLIGYNELFDYGARQCSLDDTITLIQQKTRQYAKRQQTFWKMLERQVITASEQNPLPTAMVRKVNLTLIDPPLYINQLIKDVKILCK
jgi:tRNA dimethylallyltransferase